jgi:chitodextrinase
LNATAYNSHQVNLTWKASTDNFAVAGYKVYRASSLIATIGAVTNYSDATCSPSKSYSFKVRAFDAANNNSVYSNSKSVTTPSKDTTKPSAPTNLGATAISATQINLHWKAATDNRKVVGYDIYRDGSPIVSIGAVTNYSDTTLLPLTTYSYQVRARDAEDNVSNPSNTSSATTLADTTPPTGPTNLTAIAVSLSQVDLAWPPATDNVAVTAYDIYRNTAFLTTIGVTTNYSDSSVSASIAYTFQIFARDAAGHVSDGSNEAEVTTNGDIEPPAAPSDLTAAAINSTQIDLD